MSFWGRLFGTEKALEAAVSGVSNGLDKLIYTDEEKAEAAANDRSEARKMVVGWMQATQGQNLARRFLALMITGVWLLQYVLSQIFGALALVVDNPAALESLAQFLQDGAGDMNSAVMLILAFYFAAPHMGDIAKAVTGRLADQTAARK